MTFYRSRFIPTFGKSTKGVHVDNNSTTTTNEPKRINISVDYEIQYWTKKFEISREELIGAIRKVGNRVEAVVRYLDQ